MKWINIVCVKRSMEYSLFLELLQKMLQHDCCPCRLNANSYVETLNALGDNSFYLYI